ncbi:hypothetical protein KQX54_021427 [Cotesia glomerata]|uniref:Uncharacterized protein n=1 Tax=Cotesia glomerata TaxID=32391 RepID=A0AAV7JA60_COTGL|nr:hypothetical protein KQX54_021427 [Cotesia glomerata]
MYGMEVYSKGSSGVGGEGKQKPKLNSEVRRHGGSLKCFWGFRTVDAHSTFTTQQQVCILTQIRLARNDFLLSSTGQYDNLNTVIVMCSTYNTKQRRAQRRGETFIVHRAISHDIISSSTSPGRRTKYSLLFIGITVSPWTTRMRRKKGEERDKEKRIFSSIRQRLWLCIWLACSSQVRSEGDSGTGMLGLGLGGDRLRRTKKVTIKNNNNKTLLSASPTYRCSFYLFSAQYYTNVPLNPMTKHENNSLFCFHLPKVFLLVRTLLNLIILQY